MCTQVTTMRMYRYLKQIKLIVALKVKNRIKINNLINFRRIEYMLDSLGPKSRFPVRWVWRGWLRLRCQISSPTSPTTRHTANIIIKFQKVNMECRLCRVPFFTLLYLFLTAPCIHCTSVQNCKNKRENLFNNIVFGIFKGQCDKIFY